MDDPALDRWLARLPLVERLEIQRREEQQQGWRFTRTGINVRCIVCGARLKPDDLTFPLKRCGYCRSQGRRGVRSRETKWDRASCTKK